MHLRPTTPIRSLKTVNKAINLFLKNKNKYSALRSVTKMSNPSYKTMIIEKKRLCSIQGKRNVDNLKVTFLKKMHGEVVKELGQAPK